MRDDIPAPGDATLQSRSAVTIRLYAQGVSYLDVLGGGGAYTDLTPYTGRVSQSESDMSVDVWFKDEFAGASRPQIGQLVQVCQGPYAMFTGQLDAISSDKEARGQRGLTMTVRRRDATAAWRDTRRASPVYGAGVDLGGVARDFAMAVGLTAAEVYIPDAGVVLAHDTTQIVDLNAWDAMSLCLAPALREPWVDGRGIMRSVSRDVRRPVTLELGWPQIVNASSGVARPPLTRFRVKYLDYLLTRVDQQDQKLAGESLTCGFFKPSVSADVRWSVGGKSSATGSTGQTGQRAHDTYPKIISSANSGIYHLVDEGNIYTQIDQYSGRIHLTLDVEAFLATLVLEIAGLAASSAIPDGVSFWSLTTIPIGRLVHNAALMILLSTLGHLGVGQYEVWGIPFDDVHGVNVVEAYDENAEEWSDKLGEVQNDLVPNDEVATAYAVNELIYQAREASAAGLLIADDLRVERGDVLGIPDGRRFYVQTFRRDLTRGAEATLALGGFWT